MRRWCAIEAAVVAGQASRAGNALGCRPKQRHCFRAARSTCPREPRFISRRNVLSEIAAIIVYLGRATSETFYRPNNTRSRASTVCISEASALPQKNDPRRRESIHKRWPRQFNQPAETEPRARPSKKARRPAERVEGAEQKSSRLRGENNNKRRARARNRAALSRSRAAKTRPGRTIIGTCARGGSAARRG